MIHQLGKSEVEHLYLSARDQEDVCWLDVAMHNSLGMGRDQRIRYLNGDVEDLVGFHRLTRDALFEALTLEFFHYDERMSVVVLDAVDGADIRMVELRGGASLSFESLERLGVASKILGDELQRDVAAEFEILRLIDHAHTTASEFSQDAIVGDRLADHYETTPCPAVMLGREWNPVNSLCLPKYTSRLDLKVRIDIPF